MCFDLKGGSVNLCTNYKETAVAGLLNTATCQGNMAGKAQSQQKLAEIKYLKNAFDWIDMIGFFFCLPA